MTLSPPDIKLISAYYRVRRLKALFNRTQAKLIEAHDAYEDQVKKHGSRIVGGTHKTRRARSVPSYVLKQGALLCMLFLVGCKSEGRVCERYVNDLILIPVYNGTYNVMTAHWIPLCVQWKGEAK